VDVHGSVPTTAAVLEGYLDGTTLLVLPWVNHETGMVFPIAQLGEVAHHVGARVFVDGCQALGKVPVDIGGLPVDGLALAAHKLGGPPGAGALWVRRGLDLTPRQLGGAQERGRRAGSPDPVAQFGFGTAAGFVPERLASMAQVAERRDRLERALMELGGMVNGAR